MTAVADALASCLALVPSRDTRDDAVVISDAVVQAARLDKQLRATIARNEAARIDRVLEVCGEALRLGRVHRIDILATDAADVEERAERFRRLGCDVTAPMDHRRDGYEWHAATAYLFRADGSHEIALVVGIATAMVRQ